MPCKLKITQSCLVCDTTRDFLTVGRPESEDDKTVNQEGICYRCKTNVYRPRGDAPQNVEMHNTSLFEM